MKVTLTKDVSHGDWKTALVFPDRWPTLRKGIEVKAVKLWSNFYGRQLRIIGPNGESYDIDPESVDKDFSTFRGEHDLEPQQSED